MSCEHHPIRAKPDSAVSAGNSVPGPSGVTDYWHALINEGAAAKFLGLTNRTMQAYRHRGGGPRYIRLSSRCLRYRRADLRDWADARVRTSTSDPGRGAA